MVKKVTTNKKNAPKVTKRQSNWFKRRLVWLGEYERLHPLRFWGFLFLKIVVLCVLVWQGYLWYERNQFAQAEKVLDSLQSDIVVALGEPLSSTKDKSCTYASYKYYPTRGPNCHINYILKYKDFTDETIKSTLVELVRLAERSESINTEGSDSFVASNYNNLDLDIGKSVKIRLKNNALICYINASNDWSSTAGSKGKVSLSCYKREIIPIFPVVD